MYENPALCLNVYASLARKWILPFRGRSGGTAHQAFMCQKGVCHCNQRWKQHRWFQRAGWAASSCRGDWVTSFIRKMYVNVQRSTSPETSQWEKCDNMAASLWHLAKFYMLMFTNSVVLTFIFFIMEWRFCKVLKVSSTSSLLELSNSVPSVHRLYVSFGFFTILLFDKNVFSKLAAILSFKKGHHGAPLVSDVRQQTPHE